jgi:hypothetical protein
MTEDSGQIIEVGSGTLRRPIGQDYAAAKDTEVGSGSAGKKSSRLKAERVKGNKLKAYGSRRTAKGDRRTEDRWQGTVVGLPNEHIAFTSLVL